MPSSTRPLWFHRGIALALLVFIAPNTPVFGWTSQPPGVEQPTPPPASARDLEIYQKKKKELEHYIAERTKALNNPVTEGFEKKQAQDVISKCQKQLEELELKYKGVTGKTPIDSPAPRAMEVRFSDKSVLKVVLKDDQIDFETPYGRLLIPVSDIQKIEFAVRISADERKKIDAAVSDLGHMDDKRRETATADLLALKEKAYPALVLQTKARDAQAAQRAEQVLEKLRAIVPVEMLELSTQDVIITPHSKIAGRFKVDSLRVKTYAFGEQQMKLADIRVLSSQANVPHETLRNSYGPTTTPGIGTTVPPVVVPDMPLPPPPIRR